MNATIDRPLDHKDTLGESGCGILPLAYTNQRPLDVQVNIIYPIFPISTRLRLEEHRRSIQSTLNWRVGFLGSRLFKFYICTLNTSSIESKNCSQYLVSHIYSETAMARKAFLSFLQKVESDTALSGTRTLEHRGSLSQHIPNESAFSTIKSVSRPLSNILSPSISHLHPSPYKVQRPSAVHFSLAASSLLYTIPIV